MATSIVNTNHPIKEIMQGMGHSSRFVTYSGKIRETIASGQKASNEHGSYR